MASEKPKPCPFCGSEDLAYRGTTGGLYIVCRDCAAEGPMGATEEEAIKKWDTRSE